MLLLPPPPLHSGIRSAAQRSPCRAPASDWRRRLPPEPERTANEMLMRCAGAGPPAANQRALRKPNPLSLSSEDTPPRPAPLHSRPARWRCSGVRRRGALARVSIHLGAGRGAGRMQMC